MAEQTVNVNPDGSTTFEGNDGSGAAGGGGEESTMPPDIDDEIVKGTDPAIYLLLAAVLIGFLYYLYTRKARADAEDEFFANLEDEKVRTYYRCCILLLPERFFPLFVGSILSTHT
jgi:hypothetical protein